MDFIFGILFLGVGSVATIGAMIATWRAYKAKSWPSARGVITISRTQETRRRSRIILVPEISYTYVVCGANFTGTTVRFLQPECASEMAIATCNKYPVGREVEVLHHPHSPEVSCLEVGLYSVSWLAIPIGLIVTALGGYLIQK